MPFDDSPSPVAPLASSRLWTNGATGGVGRHHHAGPGLRTTRRRAVAARRSRGDRLHDPDGAQAAPDGGGPDGGGQRRRKSFRARGRGSSGQRVRGHGRPGDDRQRAARPTTSPAAASSWPTGRRATCCASRGKAALLVSAMRDPKVLEAVDEALFGGVAGRRDYMRRGGAQTRHWRAWVRPLPSPGGATLAHAGPARRDRRAAHGADARRLPGQRQPRAAHAAGLAVRLHRDAEGPRPGRPEGARQIPRHHGGPGRPDGPAGRRPAVAEPDRAERAHPAVGQGRPGPGGLRRGRRASASCRRRRDVTVLLDVEARRRAGSSATATRSFR